MLKNELSYLKRFEIERSIDIAQPIQHTVLFQFICGLPLLQMSITKQCRSFGQGFDISNNPVGICLNSQVCVGGHLGPFDPMTAGNVPFCAYYN